jgi:hypothetical protein
VAILSVNPIDMAGRVQADAKYYKLPYDVLIGRDSDIISEYQLIKLPRLVIVRTDGKIAFTERYVTYERLKEQIDLAVK